MPAVEAIRWRDGRLSLLDQRALPAEQRWLEIPDIERAGEAISTLVVRGAPAIGITAAYACVLSARQRGADRQGWEADLRKLQAARPTAVNLLWAIQRMRARVAPDQRPGECLAELEAEARHIHADDIRANQRMAEHGSAMIQAGSTVLTHCNTGSLATGGVGTALGVIVRAWREGKIDRVYACETRPWFQGLRLTTWEFSQEGVPCSVLVDSAAASLIANGAIDWVITGADRICANGDTANKIGTLSLATLARFYGARMMIAAPLSTVDRDTPNGQAIEIEQRSPAEIWGSLGLDSPPGGVEAYNPVFDVTPAGLIDFIATERGVVSAPYTRALAGLLETGGAR